MSGTNQLSFLPDDYLERKARRRANILCALGAMFVLGVAGTVFWYTEKLTAQVEKRFTEVDRKYTEAAKQIDKVNQMRAQQQQVVRRAELAASLVEKVPRSNVLAEFTNSLPQGMSLLSLVMESHEKISAGPPAMTAFEQKRAALEGRTVTQPITAKVYDVYIKVEGVASTDVQVAQFIARLNRSPLFKDVNLLVSETYKVGQNGYSTPEAALSARLRGTDGEMMRKFQIEMMLNPNAEVMNPVNPNTRTVSVEVTPGTGNSQSGTSATAGTDTKELGTK